MSEPFYGSPDANRLFDEVVRVWIKKRDDLRAAKLQAGKVTIQKEIIVSKKKQRKVNPWTDAVKAIYGKYKPFPKFLLRFPKERDFRSVMATVGSERRREKKLEEERLKIAMLAKKALEKNPTPEPIIVDSKGQFAFF